MINVNVAEPHDLVLLGGSTAMRIDAAMLRQAFPEYRQPINLSYIAPRPVDIRRTLDRVLGMSQLKRVILISDFSLLDNRGLNSAAGLDQLAVSATNWHNAADFSFPTALASLHRVVLGTYSLPWWSQTTQPDFMRNVQPVTHDRQRMARVRQAVLVHQKDVFAQSPLDCRDIPFIPDVLLPLIDGAASKGIAVDIAFPPYPYVLNYDWIENRPRFGILLPGPVFQQFMTFKRCIVAAVEQRTGDKDAVVHVFALDADDNISGNLDNYMDIGHLLDPVAYRKILQMIAEGQGHLTSGKLADYESDLRTKISNAGDHFLQTGLGSAVAK